MWFRFPWLLVRFWTIVFFMTAWELLLLMMCIIWPGTSRCAYGLQTLPQNKDCDIWDWKWSQWRFSCRTRNGWVWGPIFWNWWRWSTSGISFGVIPIKTASWSNPYQFGVIFSNDGKSAQLGLTSVVLGSTFQCWKNFDFIKSRTIILRIFHIFLFNYLAYRVLLLSQMMFLAFRWYRIKGWTASCHSRQWVSVTR